VIHEEQPRLLEFDGIDIEAPLEGNLLVCRNLDVPGVIGKIGSLLGDHGVNIANFALGRERSGSKPVKALAVVQVDAPVATAVLDDLMKIEAILEARPVSLPEAKF
jgi:D-3-phosphoglycerate dehydrogenase